MIKQGTLLVYVVMLLLFSSISFGVNTTTLRDEYDNTKSTELLLEQVWEDFRRSNIEQLEREQLNERIKEAEAAFRSEHVEEARVLLQGIQHDLSAYPRMSVQEATSTAEYLRVLLFVSIGVFVFVTLIIFNKSRRR